MNKKQLAILSVGNILHKDEGVALYASKYLESNYSFHPSVDIIHGVVKGMSLLNIFMEYEEIIVLDAVGMEETPGSIYQFPMATFRGFSTNEDDNETGVLGCLNLIERKGNTLPKVSLYAIIPDTIEANIGLSDSLIKPFEAYILMIVKSLEDKGFSCDTKSEQQTLESVIASFKS
ncbi:MAG: hydrogenase maturation protease [Helicobacteraceae bacterium]|nr:hydrogenase maturation protease [Candidatus Sulfurimonas ponti]MBL6972976.1 hydrogenase maturation protease [Sulfurimonas sp.]